MATINASPVITDSCLDRNFAARLRKFLSRKSSGMLLDARYDGYDRRAKLIEKDAIFELTSGVYQQKFVTVWELFDHPSMFNSCIDELAKAAKHIRAHHAYTCLVACTSTARHLAEYLHSRIEGQYDHVLFKYLGNSAIASPPHELLEELAGERVLILTDVVATGRLCQRLAEMLSNFQAEPVAALSLLVTGEALLQQDAAGTAVAIDYGSPNLKSLPLYFVSDKKIETFEILPSKKTHPYPIDPISVRPEDRLAIPTHYKPVFSPAKTIAHLEHSRAISFAFYETDRGTVRLPAIQLERLIDKEADEIWKSIEPKIPRAPLIVSTFNRDDVAFRRFVEQRMTRSRRKFETAYLPQKERSDALTTHFLLSTGGNPFEDKEVLLVLAAVSSAETLRDLASLLAGQKAMSIRVLCLLNRMGPSTANFVSRIERLLRGLGRSPKPEESPKPPHAGFVFNAIYNVHDLGIAKTTEVLTTFRKVLRRFSLAAAHSSVAAKVDHDLGLLKPMSLSGWEFVTFKARKLDKPEDTSIGKHHVKVKTRDGRLYLALGDIIQSRSYERLFAIIGTEDEQRTLFLIYALLLADVGFLRHSGALVELRKLFLDRVLSLQQERALLSAQGKENWTQVGLATLAKQTRLELDLWFGLALLSQVDNHEVENLSILDKMLHLDQDPKEWGEIKQSLLAYFANERVPYIVALFAMNARLVSGTPVPGSAEAITKKCQDVMERFHAVSRQALESAPNEERRRFLEQAVSRGRGNIDEILVYLGVYSWNKASDVIRFLHSTLATPRKTHNHLRKVLVSLGNDLDTDYRQQVAAYESRHRKKARLVARERPLRISGAGKKKEDLRGRLSDAIQVADSLRRISAALKTFFGYPNTPNKNCEALIPNGRQSHFDRWIAELSVCLRRIANSMSLSKEMLDRYGRIRQTIEDTVFSDNSPAHAALAYYVVPVEPALARALGSATAELSDLAPERKSSESLKTFWTSEANRMANSKDRHYVLADRFILREVISNIAKNVQHAHSFQRASPEGTVSITQSTRATKDDLTGKQAFVDIVLSWPQTPSDFDLQRAKSGRTLERQLGEITAFGGEVEFKMDPSAGTCSARISLIDRSGLAEEFLALAAKLGGEAQ